MESVHEKSKGDGDGSTLKVQLDKSVYIDNKSHHNPNEVFDCFKEKIGYNRDSGTTPSQVFHFLTPNHVIKKEHEKEFEGFPGTFKFRQAFKIKHYQIGIGEAGCVCQNCRMFRFDNCDKPYVKIDEHEDSEEVALPAGAVSDFVAIRWGN